MINHERITLPGSLAGQTDGQETFKYQNELFNQTVQNNKFILRAFIYESTTLTVATLGLTEDADCNNMLQSEAYNNLGIISNIQTRQSKERADVIYAVARPDNTSDLNGRNLSLISTLTLQGPNIPEPILLTKLQLFRGDLPAEVQAALSF